MKHFEIEQWSDFVRGVVPRETEGRMLAHLASGCASCNRTAARYRSLLGVARASDGVDVPEPVETRAKQLFSAWAPARLRASARQFGALLFDSIRQPAMAGVRGQFTPSRQLLYHVGKYSLDLRQEREPGAPKLTLVGQILDTEQPLRALARLPVLLLSRTAIVARALTNESGEFHMEYRPRKTLTLVVAIEDQTASIVLSTPEIGEHSLKEEQDSI